MSSDQGWLENIDKGGFAERLVRSLLEKSGNLVIPYGYEIILPEIAFFENKKENQLRNNKSHSHYHNKVLVFLRSQVDFVVRNGNGDSSLVEVKFRSNIRDVKFEEDVTEIQNLSPARIILVTPKEKPYFRVRFHPNDVQYQKNWQFPLRDVEEWHINEDFYQICENLVECRKRRS